VEYVGALGGFAGVILAIVAALYAKRSADSTDKAVALARDEVNMAKTEHAEFLRQLQARARFELTVRPTPEPENGVIRVDATEVQLRLRILLRNVGDRAASESVINVVAPVGLVGELRWCGPGGEQKRDASPPADTPETLTDAEGQTWPARYLSMTFPKVTRRSVYLTFATMSVQVPREGERSVPIRVTAEADELPDDEPEASERLMIRVAPWERS
jgi:hypothetical protein